MADGTRKNTFHRCPTHPRFALRNFKIEPEFPCTVKPDTTGGSPQTIESNTHSAEEVISSVNVVGVLLTAITSSVSGSASCSVSVSCGFVRNTRRRTPAFSAAAA